MQEERFVILLTVESCLDRDAIFNSIRRHFNDDFVGLVDLLHDHEFMFAENLSGLEFRVQSTCS